MFYVICLHSSRVAYTWEKQCCWQCADCLACIHLVLTRNIPMALLSGSMFNGIAMHSCCRSCLMGGRSCIMISSSSPEHWAWPSWVPGSQWHPDCLCNSVSSRLDLGCWDMEGHNLKGQSFSFQLNICSYSGQQCSFFFSSWRCPFSGAPFFAIFFFSQVLFSCTDHRCTAAY